MGISEVLAACGQPAVQFGDACAPHLDTPRAKSDRTRKQVAFGRRTIPAPAYPITTDHPSTRHHGHQRRVFEVRVGVHRARRETQPAVASRPLSPPRLPRDSEGLGWTRRSKSGRGRRVGTPRPELRTVRPR
eukprot:360740-Chlamydomonas_euryale.AAC.12